MKTLNQRKGKRQISNHKVQIIKLYKFDKMATGY